MSKRTISLRLPIPPSANRYWRHDRGVSHLSAEALEYRQVVGYRCLQEQVEPFTAEVRLALRADFYGLYARRDLDNCAKQILDSLQQFCYANDNQLVDIRLRRMDIPKVKPKDGYALVEIGEV